MRGCWSGPSCSPQTKSISGTVLFWVSCWLLLAAFESPLVVGCPRNTLTHPPHSSCPAGAVSLHRHRSVCLYLHSLESETVKPHPHPVVEQRLLLTSSVKVASVSPDFPQPLNKLILWFYSPSPDRRSQTFHHFTALWWIKHLVICSSICLPFFLPRFHRLV